MSYQPRRFPTSRSSRALEWSLWTVLRRVREPSCRQPIQSRGDPSGNRPDWSVDLCLLYPVAHQWNSSSRYWFCAQRGAGHRPAWHPAHRSEASTTLRFSPDVLSDSWLTTRETSPSLGFRVEPGNALLGGEVRPFLPGSGLAYFIHSPVSVNVRKPGGFFSFHGIVCGLLAEFVCLEAGAKPPLMLESITVVFVSSRSFPSFWSPRCRVEPVEAFH